MRQQKFVAFPLTPTLSPRRGGKEKQMSNKNRKGVTIVELVAVMLIMAITAAVALPRISGAVTSTRLETAVNQMVADLEAARQYAISTSSSQLIQIVVADNQYRLLNKPDINHPGTSTTIIDFDDFSSSISIQSVFFDGQDNFTFDMYGKANRGGDIVLQAGTLSKTISVNSQSGKVTVL